MPFTHPVLCGSIAGRPGRFGVAMHTAAFRAAGLDWLYVAFGTEDTAGAVAAMRTLGLRGLGVTMPHKVRILPLLDVVESDAAAVGAVNTVVNDDGRLTGYNVDWQGAVAACEEVLPLAGIAAAVIGAGGGARAIAYGLIRAGATVTLFNRTARHGEALAARLGCAFGGAPDALGAGHAFRLLAHATPVGFGDADACLIAPSALRPPLAVFDAVPLPVETRLLRLAAAAGCAVIPGVRMQLHQAALQFALYTGQAADFAVMQAALERALRQP